MLRQPLLGLAGFGLAACLMPYTTVQLGVRITVSEALLGLAWLGRCRGWRSAFCNGRRAAPNSGCCG